MGKNIRKINEATMTTSKYSEAEFKLYPNLRGKEEVPRTVHQRRGIKRRENYC